jgi:hypothetical protein
VFPLFLPEVQAAMKFAKLSKFFVSILALAQYIFRSVFTLPKDYKIPLVMILHHFVNIII